AYGESDFAGGGPIRAAAAAATSRRAAWKPEPVCHLSSSASESLWVELSAASPPWTPSRRWRRKLYREALMRDYDLKRGSKYPPMSIEPFPYERQRLSGNYTDADRALRKQWLQDQILTDREPVHVERWMRRNIFRRIWNAPFDALDRALTRTGLRRCQPPTASGSPCPS
uniref:NADH dehydrogenase [ubiquinone] 1 beta subcomplex subunit 6 n=1 Tax=Macrostomum lignano TaxID=282301 RepID=A0A1I8FRD6_9PLAT